AASIGIVPEPQNKSWNGALGCQFVNWTSAAARVSFNGASPCSTRYPRLCRPVPEVSSVSVTLSFNNATSILYSEPVSSNQFAIPCFCFNLSTIAFFTIAWQSETLNNFDL